MRRRTSLVLLLSLLLVLGVAYATRGFWLYSLGSFLMNAEAPVQAQAAVVLAGDGFGHRILRGAELAKAGLVPVVYVSGPMPVYGQNEADLAIAMAVRHGYPQSLFEALPINADSTREEAASVTRFLRDKNIRKYLVVTSDFHTRRAGKLFHTADPGAEIHIVAAKTEAFNPRDWWTSRPARKIVFFEWLKTFADWAGV